MNLQELIGQYAPWILTVVGIIAPMLPVTLIKVFNDKKLTKGVDLLDLTANRAFDKFQEAVKIIDEVAKKVKEIPELAPVIKMVMDQAEDFKAMGLSFKDLIDNQLTQGKLAMEQYKVMIESNQEVIKLKDALLVIGDLGSQVKELSQEVSKLKNKLGGK